MTRRTLDLKRAGWLYEFIDNNGACMYCGLRASTYDHVIPLSFASTLLGVAKRIGKLVAVPCCRECNSIAGAKVFKSIAQKRRYLQDRLAWKYSDLLCMPRYTEQDLVQYGPWLKKFIEVSMVRRDLIEKRIKWQNKRKAGSARTAHTSLIPTTRVESSVEPNASKTGIISKEIGFSVLPRECQRAGCKLIFKPRRYWQAFCSDKCRQEHHQEEKMQAIEAWREGKGKPGPTH